MKSNYSPIKKLSKQIKKNEAWLISDPHSINYLTSCKTLLPEEREAYLIVNPKQSFLIQSSFSPKNHNNEIKTLLGISTPQVKRYLEQIIQELKLEVLYIDKDSLFVSEYEWLQNISTKGRPASGWKIQNINKNLIWDLRLIKKSQEIKLIKKACQIANKSLVKVLNNLKEGTTELEIKKELIKSFYDLGADGEAFPSIVAFGANSALPHHQPWETRLKPNMPVLIDCGAMYKSYRSDMTRTVWFGNNPSAEFIKVEKIILAAYKSALAKLNQRAEITAANLDYTARQVISQACYGNKFIHTTGHGIGLEVHEPPSLNFQNNQKIKPNMIITIEPGIYLENNFGYRHENTILITKTKFIELTKTLS